MARDNKGWLLFGGAALLLLMNKAVLAFNVKPGVVMPLTPQMQFVTQVVAQVWAKYGRMATVTSGTDSHQPGDVHTLGLALDFRTKDIPDVNEKHAMIADVRMILGDALFDILFEDEGLSNEHLHIEYDPH